MSKKFLLPLLAVLLLGSFVYAQERAGSVAFGVRGGITNYQGDDYDSAKQRAYGGVAAEYFLTDRFSQEAALNIGELAGETGAADFRSVVSSLSLMGRLALLGGSFRPYLAAGAELVGVDPNGPVNLGYDRKSFAVPFGGGFQIGLGENTALDLRGLYHYAFDDLYDGQNTKSSDDAFITGTAGLTWFAGGNPDKDGDGLTNKEEKARGTNPNLADTDGDGLTDGEEVNLYKTDPLKADSDADGLSDSDEVRKHNTNPNKADSDGDGLSDGDEVTKHNTNPSKADSDGDGLTDGAEINQHKTDANKADSDGDGLQDGREVTETKTDPLKADTDGGSVNDGTEVARGSDPNNGDDDVPKVVKAAETLKVEVGKAIVLEGVVFKSGSSELSPESEAILTQAFNTLNENADIEVEIQGHTDNRGGRALNTRLSLARAEAVKAYLVRKGIAASRITTKGFGPDKPVATNDTAEGRQQNRRIEFFRVK